jgi:hypothetical protein
MSTEIAEIKTLYQVPSKKNRFIPDYVNDILHVNRFAGGDKGTMIQLTIINNKDGYTMLTKEQVKEFIQVLTDCFDYDKYPSK